MEKIKGHKITLSSGKTALLHEYKIKHQEVAMKAIGNSAGENKFLYSALLQKELLKVLLYAVNDKQLSLVEKEDLDGLFTPSEYMQLSKVVLKLAGDEESAGEPIVEFLS